MTLTQTGQGCSHVIYIGRAEIVDIDMKMHMHVMTRSIIKEEPEEPAGDRFTLSIFNLKAQ